MKQKQFLLSIIAFTLMLGLSGCSRETYVEAKVIEGYLHTPHGKYRFQNVNDWDDWWKSNSVSGDKLKLKSRLYDSYVIADGGDVIVVYNVATVTGAFTAIKRKNKGEPTHFKVEKVETFRGDEGGGKIPLFTRGRDGRGNFGIHYGDISWGGVRVSSNGFSKKDIVYRVYIPFELNGDEYLVDFKAKKLYKKRWTTAGGYLSP